MITSWRVTFKGLLRRWAASGYHCLQHRVRFWSLSGGYDLAFAVRCDAASLPKPLSGRLGGGHILWVATTLVLPLLLLLLLLL